MICRQKKMTSITVPKIRSTASRPASDIAFPSLAITAYLPAALGLDGRAANLALTLHSKGGQSSVNRQDWSFHTAKWYEGTVGQVELDEHQRATGIFFMRGMPFGSKLAASKQQEPSLGSKASREGLRCHCALRGRSFRHGM
jgi:hypothetical protein